MIIKLITIFITAILISITSYYTFRFLEELNKKNQPKRLRIVRDNQNIDYELVVCTIIEDEKEMDTMSIVYMDNGKEYSYTIINKKDN